MRRIPVYLAPPRKGSTDDFAGRPPVIDVHVANDPQWALEKRMPNHNGRTYVAMIDTGADGAAIDAALVAEIGAQSVATGTAHGWVGTDTKLDIVHAQIVIPKVNIVFEIFPGVRNFRGDGQHWDVLLGRSFLQHCRLLVDGPASTYSLEWVTL